MVMAAQEPVGATRREAARAAAAAMVGAAMAAPAMLLAVREAPAAMDLEIPDLVDPVVLRVPLRAMALPEAAQVVAAPPVRPAARIPEVLALLARNGTVRTALAAAAAARAPPIQAAMAGPARTTAVEVAAAAIQVALAEAGPAAPGSSSSRIRPRQVPR